MFLTNAELIFWAFYFGTGLLLLWLLFMARGAMQKRAERKRRVDLAMQHHRELDPAPDPWAGTPQAWREFK